MNRYEKYFNYIVDDVMSKLYVTDDDYQYYIRLPFYISNISFTGFIANASLGLLYFVEYGYRVYGLPKIDSLDVYVKIRLRVLDLIEKYEQ